MTYFLMRRRVASFVALALMATLLVGCGAIGARDNAPIVQWQTTAGPGGPVMRAIVGDPFEPSVIYAGLANKGIYRSPDSGQTWQTRQNGIPQEGGVFQGACSLVRAFYASPTNPGRLYAALQDCGVLETQNGGELWEPTMLLYDQGNAPNGNAFLGDGADKETLYLATSGGVYSLAPGATRWELTSGQPSQRPAVDVKAQSLAWDDAGRLVVALDGQGVWTTSDRGRSWQPLNDGLVDTGLAGSALARDSEGSLFLGTFGGGIYRLPPTAAVWQRFDDGLPPESLVLALVYVPQHETLYASVRNHGLYGSLKGGPWQPLGPSGSWWALSYHSEADALYIGSALEQWGGAGGAFRSDDRGQTWTPLALPPIAGQVRDLIWLDAEAGTLLAATSLGRTYRSTDRGRTWQHADVGLPQDVAAVTTLYRDPQGVVYAGSPLGRVWRSRDDAATWEEFGEGLPKDLSGNVQALVAYDDGSKSVLFAGLLGSGIYRRGPDDPAWQSANQGLVGDPPPAVPAFLVDGNQLLASVSNSGVHHYLAAEERWQLVGSGPDQPFYVRSFAASGSRGLGRIITGSTPSQQAVGEDGLYSRSQAGAFGRVLPGVYDGLAVDIAHPQVLFTGVFTNVHPITLVMGATQPQGFDTAISLNNGKAWQLSGPLADPIYVLLADPTDATALFAGTGNGVYVGRIELPILWREVAAWAFLVTLALIPLLYLLYAYLTLTKPYGVPLPEALQLLMFQRRALATVLAEPSALSPTQQLILAEAGARRSWQSTNLAAVLDSRDAYVSRAQLATALAELVGPLHLVRTDAEGNYAVVAAGLSHLMRRRIAGQGPRLAKAVREENEIYLEAREFFRQAGFAVFARRDMLMLQPLSDGLWALEQVLGKQAVVDVDTSLLARLVTSRTLGHEEVDATLQAALDNYDQQVAGRLLFLIVAGPPDGPAYRRLAEIRRSRDLTIVLISHAAIRRALINRTTSAALLLALRRARGELKPGMLSGPVFDPLDFFDRTELIRQVRSSLASGDLLAMTGARQVGKTSLAWQAMQGLSDHLVAYVDLQRSDLAIQNASPYSDLLRELLRDGAEKYPQVEWPFTLSSVALTEHTEFTALLDRLSEAMRSQTLVPRLALIIDGLSSHNAAWWLEMAATTQTRPGVGLVGIWTESNGDPQAKEVRLLVLPFDRSASQVVVESMASQAGIKLGEATVDEFHRQSGGQPLLVRQLFGLAVSHLKESDKPDQALILSHVNAAVAEHVATSLLYNQWWRDWSPAQQRVLLSLASGSQLEASQQEAAASLERLGWLAAEDRGYRIVTGALQWWLNSLLS